MKPDAPRKLSELFASRKATIRDIVPAGFNFDRVANSIVSGLAQNKALAECSVSSIFMASIAAVRLGIEPNSPLGEGYLIPYRNKGVMEAQFQISYRGLIGLARRTGDVANIYASDIREKDEFIVELGLERRLIHKPQFFVPDRGKAIGYYAVVRFKDGTSDFEVMTIDEIEKIRKSSKAANSGPWVDWYDEMAKKTVIRRLLKRCPMSVEVAMAVAQEDNDGKPILNPLADGAIDIMPTEVVNDTPDELAPAEEPEEELAVMTPGQFITENKLSTKVTEQEIIDHMEANCGGYTPDMFSANAKAIVTQVISAKRGV